MSTVIDDLLFARYIYPLSVEIALSFSGKFATALNIILTVLSVFQGIIYHLPFLIMLRPVRKEEVSSLPKIKLTPKRFIPPILITIGVYSALSFFTVPTYLFFRDVGIEFEVNTLLFGNEWFNLRNNLIQYFLVNILIEEFVFRRVILLRLTRFGDSFACMFVSTVYALTAESIMLIPLNFALSYVLCFLTLRYRSVWVSIVSRIALTAFVIGVPILYSAVSPALSYIVINNILSAVGILGGLVAAFYYFYKKRINLRSYNGSLFFYDRIKLAYLEFSFLCAVFATVIVFIGDLRLW